VPGAGDPVADRLRAGGRALLLLADPVSVSILHHLASGSLESTELFNRVEHVSRSTYFDRMRDLEELSLVARRRRADVPPVAECWLTGSGQRLLPVAALLDEWLDRAPEGPLKLGEPYATAAIKALAVGWGSTLLRWLAERPRSLTELEPLVDGLGYRKLERTVRDLIQADLAERVAVKGRLNPYGVTLWARQAAGPLTAAMRWERHEIAKRSASVGSMEAEGALLLGLPLIDLPAGASGTCALLVDADAAGRKSLAGVVVRLMDGCPISWEAARELELESVKLEADCWVWGSTLAWLSTSTDSPGALLHMGGNTDLAEKVMAALREVGSPRRLSAGDAKPAGP
jgi:DNA-binding HxlR family transcriptional regulator